MIGGQSKVMGMEEFLPMQTKIESNEKAEKAEIKEEVIFIRRQFQPPSLLEIRFVRLKKAMRSRSASIL